MERKQFTFYESFATAVQRIRKPADRCAAYDAIVSYALTGVMPDLDNLPDSVCIIFDLIKPNLDASMRKAQGGKGKSKKEVPAKTAASDTEDAAKMDERSDEDAGKMDERSDEDTANKKEKEKEGEKEVEEEKEEEKESSLSPSPSSRDTEPKILTPKMREWMIETMLAEHGEDLRNATRDWTAYKIERREGYRPTGFKTLLGQIERHAAEHGDEAMIDIIRQSMGSGYKGIMFDRLKGKPKAQRDSTDLDAKYRMMRDWANGQG